MVLVEKFTSWTCPPCASNNPIMDAWFTAQDPDRVTGIAFHMNWPEPGNDGFYIANPNDNNARRTFYGVNSIPTAFMDGVISIQSPYSGSALTAYFNSRKDSLGPVNIIVRDSTWGDSVLVRAYIFCEMPLANPNVTVHMVVTEKEINFTSPPGTNGETHFTDVMRLMLPNGNGQSYMMFPGQTYTVERRYKIGTGWQANQLRHIVFVQGAGREILNSGMKTNNFTLVPNPAFRVVQQGSSQSAQFKIKVPFVANGYNSPITLTAEVNPPASGVTVTFPSGSVISNYPDSLTLQVNSTGSVPNGAYRIIVTGTNTNNKVHKTQVSYLVGKNYIFTNTNRAGILYKVDNVTYTSAQFFTWDLNSVHTLVATTPQGTGNTRYVFQNWNGNDTNSTLNLTINTSTSDFIANFKVQYKLVSNISPGGLPVTNPVGNQFYDSSVVVTLNPSPLQLSYNGFTYYFQRWNGAGSGSYSGTNPYGQVSMNAVISETCLYDTIPPIGIKGLGNEVPKVYSLNQNYPNPFNPMTSVKFGIPNSGDVKITVYDLLGNEVAVLVNQYLSAGFYETDWNASAYASGVYFYKMVVDSYGESKSFTDIKRMILVK